MHSERIMVGVLAVNTLLLVGVIGWLYSNQTPAQVTAPQTTALQTEKTEGSTDSEKNNTLPAAEDTSATETSDTTTADTSTATNATYTDATTGFSFKVPTTITPPETSTHPTGEQRETMKVVRKVELFDKKSKKYWDEFVSGLDEGFAGDGGPDRMTVTVYENPKNLNMRSWLIDQADVVYTNYDNQVLSPTTIGGEAGLLYLVEGLGSIDYAIVKHPTNNRIYLFSAQIISGEPQLRQDFWAIISSFTF